MQFSAMSPPWLSDLELSGTNRVVRFVAVMRSFNSSLDELCARFSSMHMHAPYVFRIFQRVRVVRKKLISLCGIPMHRKRCPDDKASPCPGESHEVQRDLITEQRKSRDRG